LRASTPLTVARSIPTGYVTLLQPLVPLGASTDIVAVA
jgi:hypothetical protein